MPKDIEDYIRKSLVQYLDKTFNVKNPHLHLSEAARNGDNFSSDVYRIIATECDCDESDLGQSRISSKTCINRFIVQLIMKTSPREKLRRQMYNTPLIFAREHYTYQKIFPAFEKFQLQYLQPSKIFAHYPKMLLANMEANMEFIILEDLCSHQYNTSYRPKALSYTKCLSVIKALAQFHAISFAYKDQQPEQFDELTSLLDEITFKDKVNKVLDPFLYQFIEYGMSTLSSTAEDQKVKGRLQQFRDVYASLMRDCVNARNNAVILHGDCWMSNLLFREKENVTDVKFIDWQGTRYGSPAIDLSYFIFCCTDSKLRRNLYSILKYYYTELVERITELGSDGKNLFTYSNLEWHMKKYARFGLGMAMLTLHVTTCDPDDMPNLTETILLEDSIQLDNITNDLMSRPAYRERISDVCRDMIKYGYL